MFQASLNYNNVLEVCGWVGLQDLADPLLYYSDRVFKHCMLQDPAFIHADFGNILSELYNLIGYYWRCNCFICSPTDFTNWYPKEWVFLNWLWRVFIECFMKLF